MHFRFLLAALVGLFTLVGCQEPDDQSYTSLDVGSLQRRQDGHPVLPVGGNLRVLLYGSTSKYTFPCTHVGLWGDPTIAKVQVTSEMGSIPYIPSDNADEDAKGPIFLVTGLAPGTTTLSGTCNGVTGTLEIIVTAE